MRKLEIEIDGIDNLSIENKEETQIIVLHKSMDLLIKRILNNNNNNLTNSMAYGTRRFNASFTRALQ